MAGIQGSFNFEYSQNEEIYSESAFLPFLKEFLFEKKFEVEPEDIIPAFVFRRNISPLRAVVKFFKENKGYSFSKISKILNRDARTIWAEYDSVKSLGGFSKRDIFSETIYISTKSLRNRKLAPLEAISVELRFGGYSNKEISLILNKNQKTIWTVLNRAKMKIANFENSLNSDGVVFK